MRNHRITRRRKKGGEANWRECFNLIYTPFMEKSSKFLSLLNKGQQQLSDLTKTNKVEKSLTVLKNQIEDLPQSVQKSRIKQTLKETLSNMDTRKKTLSGLNKSVSSQVQKLNELEDEERNLISLNDLKTVKLRTKTKSIKESSEQMEKPQSKNEEEEKVSYNVGNNLSQQNDEILNPKTKSTTKSVIGGRKRRRITKRRRKRKRI